MTTMSLLIQIIRNTFQLADRFVDGDLGGFQIFVLNGPLTVR
jgi:hypothetical protein